jgi:hypothetical protein
MAEADGTPEDMMSALAPMTIRRERTAFIRLRMSYPDADEPALKNPTATARFSGENYS